MQTLDLGDGDSRRFNVFFCARNGYFQQSIRLLRVNGSWAVATRVSTKLGLENAPIFERIDHYFPLDIDGNRQCRAPDIPMSFGAIAWFSGYPRGIMQAPLEARYAHRRPTADSQGSS